MLIPPEDNFVATKLRRHGKPTGIPDAVPSLGVTVSAKARSERVAYAQARARAWGLPYVERLWKTPLNFLVDTAARAFLVFEADGLTLTDGKESLQFHEGMAHLRLHRFNAGYRDDPLLRVADLQPGDSVLDCTLGLAVDARVAARAVGPQGRVVGLEKSVPLFALAEEGLTQEPRPDSCGIQVLHADAATYLADLADGTFDCVLIDPMFGKPRKASQAFDTLRRFADHAPLTPEMLAHARRVARRRVVVKASRYSTDLKKLGLTPEPCTRTATVLWAKVPALAAQES